MKVYLLEQLRAVLRALDGVPDDFEPELETPANPDHGDVATNAAMQLARHLRRAPRQIAGEIAERLRQAADPSRIASVEVAGPGFLNVRFADQYLASALADLWAQGDAYGRSDVGAGQTALVEYVSANPTGPLTVGHGRNAVLGDTVANLLAWTGYEVTREYYFNDAGRQMRVLGLSVKARYEALANPGMPTKTLENGAVVPASFPDDGYQGGYISDIAQALYDEHGDALLGDPDDIEPFKEAAERAIFKDIEETLHRLGIHQDRYFNEHALYTSNKVWETLDALRDAGVVYDAEGAAWFKTTNFGKDKDTVLVKSTGEPTYRLPDIAYHVDKFERGFDRIVDIFGADHIATYPDVLKGVEVLGYDASKVDVVIYQFVTLLRDGQQVKMSTRKATYETLDDLMDEVGEDVTRFFFLMRSPSAHLDFDLDLAKEAGEKNPVFYLQYAHARINSIREKAAEIGQTFDSDPDLSLLTHESETALIKELLRFPEAVDQAADLREPHRLANYLRDVATAFNQFYRDCYIIRQPDDLASARMRLADAAQLVLRNGLTILGLSAPERM